MPHYPSKETFLIPNQSQYQMGLELDELCTFGEPVDDMNDPSAVRFLAEGMNVIRYYPPEIEDFGKGPRAEIEDQLELAGYLSRLNQAGAESRDPLSGLKTEGTVTIARRGDLYVAKVDLARADTSLWINTPPDPLAPYRKGINDTPHRVRSIHRGAAIGVVYTEDSSMGLWAVKIDKVHRRAARS